MSSLNPVRLQLFQVTNSRQQSAVRKELPSQINPYGPYTPGGTNQVNGRDFLPQIQYSGPASQSNAGLADGLRVSQNGRVTRQASLTTIDSNSLRQAGEPISFRGLGQQNLQRDQFIRRFTGENIGGVSETQYGDRLEAKVTKSSTQLDNGQTIRANGFDINANGIEGVDGLARRGQNGLVAGANLFQNRTEITSGTQKGVDRDPSVNGRVAIEPTNQPNQNRGLVQALDRLDQVNQLNQPNQINPLNRSNAIFSFDLGFQQGQELGINAQNALRTADTQGQSLQNLFANAERSVNTVAVVGAESELAAEQASKLATVQAGLDVSLSDNASHQLAQLRNNMAAQAQEMIAPQQQARQLDGRNPFTAAHFTADGATAQQGTGFSSSDNNAMDAFTDASSKRGPGSGYSRMGGGMSQGGQQQGQQERRQPELFFKL